MGVLTRYSFFVCVPGRLQRPQGQGHPGRDAVCKGVADRAIQNFQLPTMAQQGKPFFDDGGSARFVAAFWIGFGSDSYAVIAHSDDEILFLPVNLDD